MSRVRCRYCDVENDAVQSAGFCDNCGKKLPPAAQAHGRREPMRHEAGGALSAQVERTPPQQAPAWLFTAAIVNLLGCGGLIVLGPLLLPRQQVKAEFIPDLLAVSVAVLVIFAGLAWWARRRPVLATITAAVVYLGLAVVDALLVPGLALLGLPVKIVIIALLVHSVRLSRKPSRLAA
ncbi:MAG: hypothetical protein ACYC3I_10265 [Gemmataceae bacterium]